MRKHNFYYNSQPQSCTKYIILFLLAIFALIVTMFAVLEVTNFYADSPTVTQIVVDSFKNFVEGDQTQPNTQPELLGDRQARATSVNRTQKSNSYYEEQSPVVVYSKTEGDSPIAQLQMAEVPPKQDPDEDDSYYSKAYEDDYEDSDNKDYFQQEEDQAVQQSPTYYRQAPRQPPNPYYSQSQPLYRQSTSSPQYYDGSRGDFPWPDNGQFTSEEARASPYHDYNNKKQSHYFPPSSIPVRVSGNSDRLSADNRNINFADRKAQSQYRPPFVNYANDYDYLSSQPQSSEQSQLSYVNQQIPQKISQYRTPSPSPPAEDKPEPNQQMDLLAMLKSVKAMWDLYQSFTTSWNTLAEKRNREEEAAKLRYRQQQQRIRINSRRPPKFNDKRNDTAANKNSKKQLSITSTTMSSTSTEISNSYEEGEDHIDGKAPAKVEPRKTVKTTKSKDVYVESSRDKRQTENGVKEGSDVGQGRYIKGDPLKGYYDFVITEGSYKFWAVFQVGTAILIIYSTFAAIYYSKVNPLVSDYDYTDYLGGARSLDGGDLDFIDDDESSAAGQKKHTQSLLEWLPRTGHSLKFVLDAIDKLPTDHSEENLDKTSYKESDTELLTGGKEYENAMRQRETTEVSSWFDYDQQEEHKAM